MLSNACKYAIRSILYLAIHSDETHKIGVKKVAEEIETPQPFLAKLLQQLVTNKLVSSSKGPKGGFFLDKKNKEKSVWDIIKTIDGTDKFDQCFLGYLPVMMKTPDLHIDLYLLLKINFNDFRDKTIASLVEEIKENGTVISLKGFNN
ncbi:RrF2 family transcriptional regulator [Aquimarina hainanensis]|uniref:RrF2 family transcriptional regulator n=1 Tax=Aquimarina hainanensis TaxID=1578017 RepID=UPI0036113A66